MFATRKAAAALLAVLLAVLLAGTATAATFRIDPDHTFPSLEFSHMGISVWRGRFNRTTGTFEYDAAARKGTVSVTVDTNSIDFGLDSMHEYAIKPDWLDVAKHPAMTQFAEGGAGQVRLLIQVEAIRAH